MGAEHMSGSVKLFNHLTFLKKSASDMAFGSSGLSFGCSIGC